MLRINKQTSRDLDQLKKTIEKRVRDARAAVGRRMAEKIAEEVLSRIPDSGGWFDIYRDSIEFTEDLEQGRWVVQGDADIELTQVPAEAALVDFLSGSDVALFLRSKNPWTVDTIPAIRGGIRGDIRIRAASASETTAHRERLRVALDDVIAQLASGGASVEANERARINGRVVADLVFLSKRLEYGLSGFPRVPHWRPAFVAAKNQGRGWVIRDAETMREIARAMTE